MILTCPKCETTYETPGELPADGRKVRCAGCQHIWLATGAGQPEQASALDEFDSEEIIFQDAGDAPAGPEPEPEPDTQNLEDIDFDAVAAVMESATGEAAGPAPEAEPVENAGEAGDALSERAMEEALSAAFREAGERRSGDSPPIVIGKPTRRRRAVSGRAAAGWVGLAMLLAGVAGGAYFQRVNVVRALPGAASAYARLGLPVNVRGLAFENVAYSWAHSAGRPVLEVSGEIVNVTALPLKVPTVVFGLRTKEKVEVYQWAADVSSELLPAGGRTAFTAQIPAPPKSIRDVQIRFAKVQ